MLNTIAVVIKRGRIRADRGKHFLDELATFNIQIDRKPSITDLGRLLALAASHQLTAYDVAYLELAMPLSVPLATRDDDLKRAALAEGVRVL